MFIDYMLYIYALAKNEEVNKCLKNTIKGSL